MAACSHTPRRLRAAATWLAGVALSAATLVGCQSNSDRDLIARDRRMQEDQIYALQDYINQYQQLLCRYRTENASLRRQLAEGAVSESPSSLPPLTPSRTSRPSRTSPAAPPGAKERESSPPTQPGSDSQAPEIPPLNSSGFAAPPIDASAKVGDFPESIRHVVTASYNEPLRGETASAASDQRLNRIGAAGHNRSNPSAASTSILISGEVVANSSGGPRIMVDVVPPTATNDQPFDGSASLMLLRTDASGEQQNIGRWDFSADDVCAALLEGAARPTLRFFVELPAGANVDGATQLWTRLVPHEGPKLLAHAKIDLAQPGIFSSRTESDRTRLADELILAANCVESPATTAPSADTADDYSIAPASSGAASSDVSATINEADWAVAQPGKPANLPLATADQRGASGWRVSAEPMPIAVAQSIPAASLSTPAEAASAAEAKSPLLEMLPSRESPSPDGPLAEMPVRRPSWAPGRDDEGAARHIAVRPNWSAKR